MRMWRIAQAARCLYALAIQNALCHEVRDELVHRTTDAVQSSLLRSPGFCSSRKACNNAAVFKKSTWPSSCQSCYSRLNLFWYVEDCASTLEEHGSLSTGDRKRVASIASPAIDTQASRLAIQATLLLGVTALLFALITLGKNTSWKLSRQLACYTISMSTSHLRVEMLSDAVRWKSRFHWNRGLRRWNTLATTHRLEALAKVSATLRRVTQPLHQDPSLQDRRQHSEQSQTAFQRNSVKLSLPRQSSSVSTASKVFQH